MESWTSLILITAGIAAVFLSWRISSYSFHTRKEEGIPEGEVIYSDLTGEGKTLSSPRFRLAGRPDCILRRGRLLIPVEFKSSRSNAPDPHHIAQLACYCLLVEESYGVHVPYGILVYPEGRQYRIPFDPHLRWTLETTLQEMRSPNGGANAKPNPSISRCRSCVVRHRCKQALT